MRSPASRVASDPESDFQCAKRLSEMWQQHSSPDATQELRLQALGCRATG
ncbi:MAG: hypothetical protein JWL84_3263 [Rhodospirillales bacterium]|nr:hypothetical protein [Rhodospirillales bacterium]